MFCCRCEHKLCKLCANMLYHCLDGAKLVNLRLTAVLRLRTWNTDKWIGVWWQWRSTNKARLHCSMAATLFIRNLQDAVKHFFAGMCTSSPSLPVTFSTDMSMRLLEKYVAKRRAPAGRVRRCKWASQKWRVMQRQLPVQSLLTGRVTSQRVHMLLFEQNYSNVLRSTSWKFKLSLHHLCTALVHLTSNSFDTAVQNSKLPKRVKSAVPPQSCPHDIQHNAHRKMNRRNHVLVRLKYPSVHNTHSNCDPNLLHMGHERLFLGLQMFIHFQLLPFIVGLDEVVEQLLPGLAT